MSIESARAFCMRMMSDDEFRDSLGAAPSADVIKETLQKENYSFSKFDLLKIIGELTGKKIEADELEKMVCGIYEEEIAVTGNNDGVKHVSEWFRSLE